MLNGKPILTNFYQIIGLDMFQELQSQELVSTEQIDWGSDRVISLRNRDTSVKTQWNGTCTSFAVIAAIENKLNAQFDLSEKSLWDSYGVYSTEQAIKAAENHYIFEEKYWPKFQSIFNSALIPKGRFLLSKCDSLKNRYLDVLKAIDSGNPCVVALRTPRDLYKGMKQIERTSRIMKGGHAMCVSGYKVENGRAYFLVKNSWGVENGHDGYQYVDFGVFDKKGYAWFWEIKEVFDRGEQAIFDDDLYSLIDEQSERN